MIPLRLALFWILLLCTAGQVAAFPFPFDDVDTAQYGKLNRQSVKLLAGQPEKAGKLAFKALQLSTENKDTFGQIEAFKLIGKSYHGRNDYDSAIYYYHQANQLAKIKKSPTETIQLTQLEAMSVQKAGNPEKALSLLLGALTLAEKAQIPNATGSLYRSIGRIYYELHNFQKAEKYLQLSLKQFQQVKPVNYAELIVTLQGIGKINFQQGKYDSAQAYFKKSLPIAKKVGDQTRLADLYNGLGAVNLMKSDYVESLKMLLPALRLFKKLGDKASQASVLNNLGSCYLELHQPEQAVTYLLDALAIAKSQQDLQLEHDIRGNLSNAYLDLNNTEERVKHLARYAQLKDSLYNSAQSRQTEELQEKYEAEKKGRQIQLLRKDRQLAEAQTAKRTIERNALIAGLLVTLLGTWLIVRGIRHRQRASSLLAEQVNARKEELNRQRFRELVREQELVTIRATLEGQEQERMRIGQDLHDRLGSMLATIKLFFHLPPDQQGLLAPKQIERYHIATKLLDDAYQEVRRISHDMVSNLLVKFGLVEALKELSQTINESNQVRLLVNCHNMEKRLDTTVEVTLFRIVQELVTNALNHAQATEINVSLINQDQQSLHLLVEDNGVGFDPEVNNPGMGMQILKARVLQLNGTLEFDSGRGNGTTVTLDIPLQPGSGRTEQEGADEAEVPKPHSLHT